MGGYECADHINRSGDRINLLEVTAHDVRAEQDYKDLASIGILVAREGVCWSAVETSPYVFDFSEVKNRILAAEKHGIQLMGDMIHFGYPDGLYPTHPHFCNRFAALCSAFAAFYKSVTSEPLLVVPVNEISFLSWHSGDVRGTVPFAVNCGWDMKYHLCKAALVGIRVFREADPDCRIVMVEPLIKIHALYEHDNNHVYHLNQHQFQAMDIIGGRMCPELGGREEYLDILGFNYYWNSQWEHGQPEGSLPWPETDTRRTSIATLLDMAYQRYKKPIFLSETGHFGEGRALWIEEITDECITAVNNGVELLGMCIYPVIDRPDWDNLNVYHDCGIWDMDEYKNRIPHADSIEAILEGQKLMNECLNPEEHPNIFEKVGSSISGLYHQIVDSVHAPE